jgi:hypothetical protein
MFQNKFCPKQNAHLQMFHDIIKYIQPLLVFGLNHKNANLKGRVNLLGTLFDSIIA